jgi:hypothetical protein
MLLPINFRERPAACPAAGMFAQFKTSMMKNRENA